VGEALAVCVFKQRAERVGQEQRGEGGMHAARAARAARVYEGGEGAERPTMRKEGVLLARESIESIEHLVFRAA